jgi:hypothetical protein
VKAAIGTVELAETVSVPPLSGRIARGRVVRRGDSADFKAPPKYELMVEPVKRCLPGIYLARIVATVNCKVDNIISSDARGKSRRSVVPLGSEDAENWNSPCDKIKSGSCEKIMTPQRQAGSGERQPESPKSSLQEADPDSLLEIDIEDRRAAPRLQWKVLVPLRTNSVLILTHKDKLEGTRAIKLSTPGKPVILKQGVKL